MDSLIQSFINLLAALPDDFVDQFADIEREKTMSTELKIKIASLAAEAAIIRRHERRIAKARARRGLSKGTDPTWSSIQSHRRHEVRWEARHALLAQAFLKGRSLADIEPFSWHSPRLSKVMEIAARFAPGMDDFGQRWTAWQADAKKHLAILGGWKGERDKRAGEICQKRLARVPLTDEQRAARARDWAMQELARDAQRLGLV